MRRCLLAMLVLVGLGSMPAAAAAQSAAPAPPAGWKRVSYASVTFEVPAGWPVYDLGAEPRRCARLDVHAVYLGGQGVDAACPARAVGRTEALQIEPLGGNRSVAAVATQATTVGGQLARTEPFADAQRAIVVALDRAGLVVTASYGGDPALARRILASVRPPGPGGLSAPGSGGLGAPGPGGLGAAGARLEASATTSAATSAAVAPTFYKGKGFDTCAAPSTSAMGAWRKSSRYRAIGIYIGGAMRACGDGNLSASWVSTVTGMGWRLIPIYVGLQAPCVFQPGLAHIVPSGAAAEGARAAADAVTRASLFGLGRGTPIYYDMEAYDNRQATCVQAVRSFLSGWTGTLHRLGYRSGVYSSAATGVTDLVGSYNSPTLQRPDYIWFAHWTGKARTKDRSLPSWAWQPHRRIGQYRGGHLERHGGVTINIDNDQVNSVVVGAG